MRLFSDYDSDQSTCIYVDSSLNSLIRSELNSSELNSSELNNSSTSTFSDFSSNESFLDKLKCYYTNADWVLNKIEELEVVISIENLNIIIVREIFLKNLKCTNIDKNEYKIRGFSRFMGLVVDACRGVAIFIKDDIKADFCYDLNKTLF